MIEGILDLFTAVAWFITKFQIMEQVWEGYHRSAGGHLLVVSYGAVGLGKRKAQLPCMKLTGYVNFLKLPT